MISLSLLCIYFPIQCTFVYRAIPLPLEPYSWSRVHDPASWNPILYYHTSDAPLLQYNNWGSIGMGLVMFLYFGFNDESIDTYRRWMVKIGFGKVWPSLKEPRRRRGSSSMGSRGSFGSHFDLVGEAMRYFDGSARKESRVTSAGLSSEG